jgi:uncharacterized protein YdhG (YjbR/CyaY superfamily)
MDKKQSKKMNIETIDDYIARYPRHVQRILKKLRQTIREATPEAQEVISYRIPTFRLNGNLVHFGAFRDHIGFFPTSSARENFGKELSKYEGGRGTIQFPLDKPIPYALVRKIVKFRVKENHSEKRTKATRA